MGRGFYKFYIAGFLVQDVMESDADKHGWTRIRLVNHIYSLSVL